MKMKMKNSIEMMYLENLNENRKVQIKTNSQYINLFFKIDIYTSLSGNIFLFMLFVIWH